MRALLASSTLLLSAALLAGCATAPSATEVTLSYESQPAGATLFEGGQPLGVAPQTRSYKAQGTATTVRTPDVTAVWPSGAKTVYFTILPLGADRVATLERPAGAPNLQADLDHAKKLAAANERDSKRTQEALQRDLARNSARCKEQMAKGNLATNDC